MSFNKDKSEIIGILFSLINLCLLGFLIYVYIKYPFYSTDEWYTLGIIRFSFLKMIGVAAVDVHPPLYYLLLMIFLPIFQLLNMNIDIIYFTKFIALIPLFILLILSYTKIKDDYGLLTASIFSFALLVMSRFFRYFIVSRMYSWAILFLVLSFICVAKIIENEDINYKYWILFTIFSVLGAYTHYFAAISSVALYIILFIFLLLKRNKQLIKGFVMSVCLGILLYLPWVLILLGQLKSVHNSYHIKEITLNNIIQCLSFSVTISNNEIIQLLSIVALVIISFLFIKSYLKSKNNDDFYLLMGLGVFFGTLIISLAVSFTFKPILTKRYLIPAIAVLWLCISIKFGKLPLNKMVILLLFVMVIVGAFNLYHEYDEIRGEYDKTLYQQDIFEKINNNNSIVLYDNENRYVSTYYCLNKVYAKYSGYIIKNESRFLDYDSFDDITYKNFNISSEIKSNGTHPIYIITFVRGLHQSDYDGYKVDYIGKVQRSMVYEVIPN